MNETVQRRLHREAVKTMKRHREYLEGLCHALAIELHRLTGKPLMAAIDFDINQDALVHAWVQWDEDFTLDIGGLRTADEMMEGLPCHEPRTVVIQERELLGLGGKPTPVEWEAAKSMAEQVLDLATRQEANDWVSWEDRPFLFST